CGRGLMLLGAAARLTTGRAVGIDLWQGADLTGNSPAATLANAEAAGVAGRVEVHTGDARQLPFPDADFDVVLSTAALHNIPDASGRDRAVREVARVLKPGGRVVLADIQHLPRYAEVLRQGGLPDARAEYGWAYWPVFLITWSAIRAGTVTGR